MLFLKCRSLFHLPPYSRNLLTVLPKYLFSLPLKVLLVSNNKLVSIPDEIGKAKELMELVSSAEAWVHVTFCACWVLAARVISTHILFHRCQDVSCNEIQVLPAQVGRLQSLRELNVRKNCLHVLPEGQFRPHNSPSRFFFFFFSLDCSLTASPSGVSSDSFGKDAHPLIVRKDRTGAVCFLYSSYV